MENEEEEGGEATDRTINFIAALERELRKRIAFNYQFLMKSSNRCNVAAGANCDLLKCWATERR